MFAKESPPFCKLYHVTFLNFLCCSHTSLVQGMPEAWAKLLQNSGISREEKKKNPQAVVDILKFYTNRSSRAEEESKFLTAQRYGKENNM